eukprot:2625993-Pleurochrysis_carterae.AAC.1
MAPGESAHAPWARVSALLCAMGMASSLDGGGTTVTAAAAFLAGAGQAAHSAGAVEWALLLAQRAGARGRRDRGTGAPGWAAGELCAAALRRAIDSAGPDGAAEMAREARAFKADLGVAAGAVARGGFLAQALRARAMAEVAARDTSSAPVAATRPTVTGDGADA